MLTRRFFDRPFLTVAQDLIGCTLDWDGCGGRIVEVEAYGVDGDAACHTAHRPGSRDFVRSQPPGTAYVYLNYGMYWLLNVLAQDGIILFRAVEPSLGIPLMQQRRGRESLRELCSGPGKLGRALELEKAHHGIDLARGHFRARKGEVDIVAGPRIGISQAVELPWRFAERDSPYLSVRI